LSQFIIRRLSELAASEMPLRQAIAEIEAEREQLRRAGNAAGVDIAGHFDSDLAPTISRAPRRTSEATIKDAVLEVLRESRQPMTALEILPFVNAKLGLDYPRTSLSPQLSRLKNDGLINRDGSLWSLAVLPPDDVPPPAENPPDPSPEGAHLSDMFR